MKMEVDEPTEGYTKVWTSAGHSTQVAVWPFSGSDRYGVSISLRPVTRGGRSRPVLWSEGWHTLKPAFSVSRDQAILVALDIVGHLTRLRADRMTFMRGAKFVQDLAERYGWDGKDAEVRVDQEAFALRRERGSMSMVEEGYGQADDGRG